MAIKNLIPSFKGRQVPVRREEWSNPFVSLQREMNRLFDSFFNEFAPMKLDTGWSEFYPTVDIKENEKEVKIEAELPGMDEKDIDIRISGNVLTLKGEKKQEREERNGNYYRMERSYGSFHREIMLPAEVEEDKAEAFFKKGVLTIRLPKKPEAQSKMKRIEIKTS